MPKNQAINTVSLYHYQACPFCDVTRKAIKHLKLDVELRNIQKSQQHHQTLVSKGGKKQVPCLRIESANGSTQWLYESRSIIHYLHEHQQQLQQSA